MTAVWRNWRATFLCVALLVGAVAVSHPVSELPIADDFSYWFSAKALASTGHLAYNGWSAPMLGIQMYWGALFLKVFGYSQFAVRLSGLCAAILATGLLHRILLRCGITGANAILGTLTVALSPIFLPLSYTFMTDVPGLLALLVSFYFLIRAVLAEREHRTNGELIMWLGAAVSFGVLLGTTRQIAWLGVLTGVPTVLVMVRKRRPVLPWGVALWLLGCASIFYFLHWFQLQPYSLRDENVPPASFAAMLQLLGSNTLRACLEFPTAVLPVAITFACYVKWTKPSVRKAAVITTLVVASICAPQIRHHTFRTWLQPTIFGVQTDHGTWFNFDPDQWSVPIVLSVGWRFAASLVTLIAVFAVCAVVFNRSSQKATETSEPRGTLIAADVTLLVVPTMVVYGLLLLPRAALYTVFDRYLLFPMVGAIILLLRAGQRFNQGLSQKLGFACLAVLAWFSILSNHDMYAVRRAKLQAATHLVDTGTPRTSIRAGLEYDGSTEIMTAGYINDFRVNPRSAFVHVPSGDWRAIWFRHVVPRFYVAVVDAKVACINVAPPIPVHNWLGPRLAIETVPMDPDMSLAPVVTCP